MKIYVFFALKIQKNRKKFKKIELFCKKRVKNRIFMLKKR